MDRRRSERHIALFPAHLVGDETDRTLAVVHDMSVTGVRIFSKRRVAIGDSLHLRLYLLGPDSPLCVSGRVVRFERRANANTWPYEFALQFDRELVDVDAELARVADAQARLNPARE